MPDDRRKYVASPLYRRPLGSTELFCPTCGRSFNSDENMRLHLMRHV